YLNRPALTAEKFIDNPFGEGKLYRTGDLAYWREDGNIVFVGRNDFQVKIRGLRIELGEIEKAIMAVDGIVSGVVVVRKDKTDRQLICAFYTGEEKSAKELRAEIGKRLPKYMIPHIFMYLENMPMTTSGKINRNALPELELENITTETEYVAPVTEMEILLVDCIKDVLGSEKVSVLDNFFDIGGDSLKSIELTARLEAKGYTVSVKTIFASKDIASLATELIPMDEEEETVAYGNILPATAAQMRVYTAQMMQSDATLYNIPYVFKVEKLDVRKLQSAINKLIVRHESFRTHFENIDGHIMQVIDDFADISVEKLANDNVFSFVRPFNLERSPLLRVGFYENTVLIDMHHIISDGGTMPVFFKELNELYMDRALADKVVQYGEFAMQKTNMEESEKYWLSVFEEEVPVLELPQDFERPTKQSFNGAAVLDLIDMDLHKQITDKCREVNITPHVFYMTCFNILLSKFSGNEDITVGMPVSGRQSKFLETAGMFVNTIVLRNKPNGNKTILALLNEVKNNSVLAIENQNYPFGGLVKKLHIESISRNPLFDVMFIYQSEQLTNIIFGDKKAELLPATNSFAKYDITFTVLPRTDDVVLAIEYCTDLYTEKTILNFKNAFKRILAQSLDETLCIRDVQILSAQEKQKVLVDFNSTSADYPKDKCVHELFEAQAARTPDKTAVVAVDKTLTYKELNEEANRIAHSLMEKGVGRGDIVGLMLPRKSYLLSALFGILKTGAAYLPIDSELPEERIAFMCKDTNARLVISSENIDALLQSDCTENPAVEMQNTALCYCIYTSGSTGQPKGVMAKHRNVVNYISKNEHNIAGKIITDDFEKILSVSTCSFDIFVTETVLPLVHGLCTVLADEQQCRNQTALRKVLEKEKAEFLQTTPTKLKALIADPGQRGFLQHLKAVLLGGEAMEWSFLQELRRMTNAKIYNIYGATEVPIWSTFADTDTFTDVITIGHPIANTKVYIVDKHMQPVPIGVTGELCIAGDSVAGEYLNRPALTAEKFIDNPFGEGKLYRTGDLAYWREDGNIVFVGRNDFQV
ncbi:MAG: amino acid adenylation domain-containing protein, partial [Clostridia bacterium]|nr:amino acid adenylation domain-containing protein [Clostridia bacterium]